MRHSKVTLALIAVLIVTVSIPALARGGRSGKSSSHAGHSGGGRAHPGGYTGSRHIAGPRVGVFLGAPVFAAPLYAPYYYPPPRYFVPPGPPLYMEQSPDPNFWYFCPESNTYYPYVQQCPGGWQQVVPQPPGAALNAPG